MNPLIYILCLCFIGVLIFMSAFFSGVEMGFFSANIVRIKTLSQMGSKHARLTLHLFSFLPYILIAILVGNCLVNTAAAVFAQTLFGNTWKCAFAISVIVLVFGEILPKEIFRRNPTQLLLYSSGIISFLYRLLSPIVRILSKVIFVEKIFTKKPISLNRIQIHSFIIEARRQKTLKKEEKILMQRVLKLSRKKVKEVMTPRVDVVMVQKDADIEDVIELLKIHKYSRFPVYGNDTDEILGVLYIKDILKAMHNKKKVKIMDLVRPAYFVPETKQIGKLLSIFQKEKIHIAIVVDEYGGMSGIVTIGDLLEEIVGEIEDIHDKEAPKIHALGKSRFLVDARIPLRRLHDKLGLHFYTTDYETLGGYVIEKFDRIPLAGESIETEEAKIIVKEANERTLLKLEIIKKT